MQAIHRPDVKLLSSIKTEHRTWEPVSFKSLICKELVERSWRVFFPLSGEGHSKVSAESDLEGELIQVEY